MKLLQTQNKIVMISRQSNTINKDFKLLNQELEKKYKVIILCKTLKGKENANYKDIIKYGMHMFKQMYHLSTSKVCILDSYCPTVSILKHKKDLTIIQIWHSIGTMKKFGYTVIDKKEGSSRKLALTMKMHQNYNIVYCSSKEYLTHLEKGFNIEKSKIKVFTLPRIDLLNDKEYEKNIRNEIIKKYPILKEKKNIVYAPTFRKNEENFKIKLNELFDSIDYKKYNLIIKLHPLSNINFDNKKVIFDTSFSTFDMLFIADKLISDYSCIVYEAGIRNIPLYFYCFDIDKYNNNRGLAIDINELPGYIEKDAKNLIKSLEKKYDIEYQKKFIKKYVKNTDNCTKLMVNDIIKYLK